jgi:hypothetical protein
MAFARRAAHLFAHQGERDLAGQQLVISEPRPGGTFGRQVAQFRWMMQAAKGVAK